MSTNSEQTVAAGRATVLFYDNATRKWSDNQVLSDVEIYQNKANNTFRVNGQSVQDGKNTINVNLVKEVKYSRANEIFIQWRDPETKRVIGLSFASGEEAALFDQWMSYAISVVGSTPAVPAQQNSQSHYQRPQPPKSTPDGDDAEADRASLKRPSAAPPAPKPPAPPAAPPAPAAAPPPPKPPAPPAAPPVPACPAGGPPPPPPGGGPPPPPPPPPLPSSGTSGGSGGGGSTGGGLAAALAGAKLKKVVKPEEKNDALGAGPSATARPAGGGAPAPSAAPAPSGGGGDMMSEMAKRLQARKARTEGAQPPAAPAASNDQHDVPGPAESPFKAPPAPAKITKTTSIAPTPSVDVTATRKAPFGTESPAVSRSNRAQCQLDESATTYSPEMESLKQDILAEMRRELQKIKDEIVEAIISEMNRR